MLKPTTLDEAITLARLQEGAFNNLLAKAKTSQTTKTTQNNNTTNLSYKNSHSPPNISTALTPYKPPHLTYNTFTPSKPNPKPTTSTTKNRQPSVVLPVKKLAPTEMQARRDQGLYYNYDEIYSFGHRCKKM